MKTLLLSTLLAGLTSSAAVLAMAPAGAPAGTMGKCNDGSYSSSAEKKGACRGHKGVKDWYGGEMAMPAGSKSTTTTTTTTPTTAPMTNSPAGQTTTTKSSTTTVGGPMAPAPMREPAMGGGSGKVWMNTSTKVYHCSGDKYYGKTKHGEYVSEADAKAKGAHADHGKSCT